MTSLLDEPGQEAPAAEGPLPSIGIWWPMLESPLQLEILEHPTAPLRGLVVRRIFELCDLEDQPVPRSGVRLGPNERAYIAGWVHAVDWI
ncbi:hypothetical protein BCL57_002945 [Agromyces flavus]|uniref:Uncharacterized protein n=1 Tax=Agromyces flavus TaxID=589382 RepID=A0A1H1MEJ9_9MICO|nr:hypothetical protein [Agromyces flavus]MCP2368769.1 hypothetical protein [Agromyces flavus]GGI47993.1 hypothetical protein GCM10010932_26810 [Agromyces flavus]SDR85261.1 hypothetical protein SAMN04489721_0402 [Agromyces flavus]